MFGFFRYKASLKLCIKAVADALAPVRMLAQLQSLPLPNTLFGDAYVLGFFQAYLTFVMQLGRKNPIEPFEQLQIFTSAVDFYVPGSREKIIEILGQLNDSAHPFHQHYVTGRRDGLTYVEELQSGKYNGEFPPGGVPVVVPGLHDFIQFLKKNYLGKSAAETMAGTS